MTTNRNRILVNTGGIKMTPAVQAYVMCVVHVAAGLAHPRHVLHHFNRAHLWALRGEQYECSPALPAGASFMTQVNS